MSRRSMRATQSHLNVLTKLSATPLLCGLKTGVLIGVGPSERAIDRVWAETYAPPLTARHSNR